MQPQEPESNRPQTSAFKQQQLQAWQPILTPKSVITTFIVIGIVFVPIGIAVVVHNGDVVEISERYDDEPDCIVPEPKEGEPPIRENFCDVTIKPSSKMKGPVYLYYQLTNYYQNHRRYVKSRSDQQLRGEDVGRGDLEDCKPKLDFDETADPKDVRYPCGLVAWSYFNDTFGMSEVMDGGATATVDIDESGISWKSDRKKKFQNPENDARINVDEIANLDGQMENEHFIVWMRTAALPTFRKLWGKIDQDLEEGHVYNLRINSLYDVSGFDGKKHIVLSTTSAFGGKNEFLGASYLTMGIVSWVLALAFFLKNRVKPRRLGDAQYLDWKE